MFLWRFFFFENIRTPGYPSIRAFIGINLRDFKRSYLILTLDYVQQTSHSSSVVETSGLAGWLSVRLGDFFVKFLLILNRNLRDISRCSRFRFPFAC